MSLVYIAEFSKENIKIGENFKKKDKKTVCLLWKNSDLEKSKDDFYSNFEYSGLKNFFIIETLPSDEKFADSILSFIKNKIKYPETIVVRGCLHEIWSLAVMKSMIFVQSECHLILDDVQLPLKEYENFCLDSFDFIYSMNKNSNIKEYYFKTKEIFKNINSNLFKIVPKYFIDLPEVSTPLVFCNSINIEKIINTIEEERLESSIINIEEYSNDNLAVFGMLSNNIIDESENYEFSLALLKIGKKGVSLENFVKDYKCLCLDIDKYIEEFAEILVNIISRNIGSNKGKDIIGFEIN